MIPRTLLIDLDMKAPDKIYVEVCEDGIFAFPEPPFKESVEYIRKDALVQNLDEAAREIVIKMHPCLKDCTILGDRLTRGELMDLVKAGAEWMAKQMKQIPNLK